MSSFHMRADFIFIWLMVDYLYGDIAENASEMNVSLNVTAEKAHQLHYGVE